MTKNSNQVTRKKFDPKRKLRVFFSGLKFAILGDFAVAYKVLLSLIVLSISFWLREWFDFLLILIVTGVMVITEIFNMVVEALCDYIQPEHDPKIGEIKDIAAFAAGISILIWVFTLGYELWRIWVIIFG